MKNYLSLVIIVKDEDDYLDEFIYYYRLLGVDHFYFYDNDSAIPLTQSLKKHKDYVTIHTISGKARQLDAYRHHILTYKKDTRWSGFIDIDEFIVPKTTYKLSEFLVPYEYADALAINWIRFGDNNHITKPTGLVTENYTKREFNQNAHIKSIVNPLKAQSAANPHYITMREGATYIDAAHNPIISPFNENPTIDIIQMNHYFTKSSEEFIKKALRGRADTGEQRDIQREYEQCKHAWNALIDLTLVEKYLPELKKSMGL